MMQTVIKSKYTFTVQIVELEDGTIWADSFDPDGMVLCSSEEKDPLAAMVDLSYRMYGGGPR